MHRRGPVIGTFHSLSSQCQSRVPKKQTNKQTKKRNKPKNQQATKKPKPKSQFAIKYFLFCFSLKFKYLKPLEHLFLQLA